MRVLCLLLSLGLFMGCGANRKSTAKEPQANMGTTSASTKPTPAWLPKDDAPYQPSQTRHFQLIHTALNLLPNWQRQTLFGEAYLTLRPWFKPHDSIVLDAKWLRIHQVALDAPTGKLPLSYRYNADSTQLHIQLNSRYQRTDTLRLYVQYTAEPAKVRLRGSESIADARGLYFINADGKHPYKPMQLWTQGQPESASCWFPTIDDPAQRCTQEVSITVPDTMVTLSNGLLIRSTTLPNGMRTDYWRMDQPHAPYLFMIAAGKFAIIEDSWQNRPVTYYVEPQYAPYARMVFGNTPEMLDFYSQLFGVPYPWPKYAQMVVQDFVSGAMENTTATIHHGGLQHDSRAHLDETEEDYISHELVHQWFGNYVTCESWANLTLNEGITTYGEYLWREYKYGKTHADAGIYVNLDSYLSEATKKREPVIRHHHHAPGDMFDSHSYSKGGLIFHWLRLYTGDEAFFASLQHYLRKHAYEAVEVHHLRLAFEEVTGEDLNWFFDQWLLKRGHPEVQVSYSYDYSKQHLRIHARQTQDRAHQPLYKLHFVSTVAGHAGKATFPLTLSTPDTVFAVPYPAVSERKGVAEGLPSFIYNVLLDDAQSLPGDIHDEKPLRSWLHQAQHHPHFLAKLRAIEQLEKAMEPELTPDCAKTLHTLALHPQPELATAALGALETHFFLGNVPAWTDSLIHYYQQHPKAAVRVAALDHALNWATSPQAENAKRERNALLAMARAAIADSSYLVVKSALTLLAELAPSPTEALKTALSLQDLPSGELQAEVSDILLSSAHPQAIDHLVSTLWRTPGIERYFLMATFGPHIPNIATEDLAKVLPPVAYIALNDPLWIMRMGAVRVLIPMSQQLPEAKSVLETLRQKEQDERLKKLLQMF